MIASIMVIVGTTLTPVLQQQVNAALQLRNQHMNQENLCYRTNTCRQSDVGQNTLGNDNSVTGFADQSDNIQQSAAAPTTTPGNNTTPTPTPTPTPRTCVECFTTFLNSTQITTLLDSALQGSLATLCTALGITTNSESALITFLTSPSIGLSVTGANDLIACLKAAGIVFQP